MKLIALTGGPYGGKTSLARALEGRGYLLIPFTDLLKKYAAQSLTACGTPTTVNQILSEKAKYRPFLQELGGLIGFNDNPKFIEEALSPWDGQACVFDNVRTPEQWAVLRGYGFGLVEVHTSEAERLKRAVRFGVPTAKTLQHPIEGMLEGYAKIVLDGSDPPEYNALKLERI